MIKLWRGERVREWLLALLGRHTWTLAIPGTLIAVVSALLPEEIRVIVAFLGLQMSVYGSTAVLLAAIAAAYLLVADRYGPEEITLDAEGLRIGRHRIPRSELASAWSIAEDRLEIFTHGGDEYRLLFRSPEDAARLGEEIRAASDRSKSYALTSGAYVRRLVRKALSVAVPFSVGGALAAMSPWLLPLLPVAGFVGWLGAKGSRRAQFAADGVLVEGRFKSRFVPYREIAHVEVESKALGHRVRIELVDETELLVLDGMSPLRAELVSELLTEGIGMVHHGADAGAHVPRLDRAGADDEVLRDRLRSVSKGARYRSAAMDEGRLHQLMRNPASSPEQRVAAAVALRGTEAGRAQIRIAAAVSAEPDVKQALEALSSHDLAPSEERKILRRVAN